MPSPSDGIAFSLGSLDIYWYGILVFIGGLACLIACYIEWRKKGYSNFHFFNLAIIIIIFSLFGSRWWYLMFHPQDYDGFGSLFQVNRGRAIMGAIFFSVIAITIYVKFFGRNLNLLRVYSIILPNFLLAQSIGRWGNFTNQEIYGSVVEDISWLPDFIEEQMFVDSTEIDGKVGYRNPLFLYESLATFFLWMIITFVIKPLKLFKAGSHAAISTIGYSLIRSVLELYRDELFVMRINNFASSFWLSIIFFALGIISLIIYQFYYVQIMAFFNFKTVPILKRWWANISAFLKLVSFKIDFFHYKAEIKFQEHKYNQEMKKMTKEALSRHAKSVDNIYV